MEISLEQKKRIKEVIKYNVSRRYFIYWAPRDLYNCYSTLFHDRSINSIKFGLGNLSVDKVCNVLWTEMSYNPVRFGTQSPFEINGKNSLQYFCNMEIDENLKSAKTLLKVQNSLKEFYHIACDQDKNFEKTNRFKNTFVEIRIYDHAIPQNPLRNYMKKPAPNIGYKMLTELIHCIHTITSQNLADLNRKTYFEPMFDVVLNRHPNLIRGRKYINFAPYQAIENTKTDTPENLEPQADENTKTDIPENLKPQLKKYLRLQSKLEKAIAKKSDDMYITQARIDNLNNLENPGDTRIEQARLNRDNENIEKLEEKLIDIKSKIAKIKAIQYVM